MNLSEWFGKVEKIWKEKKGKKADKMDIYERLDYMQGITRQDAMAPFRVLYNSSGTFLASAVVAVGVVSLDSDSTSLPVRTFVADYKTHSFDAMSREEAYYLSSLLNAPFIDKLIKPMQSRGLWGPRDIGKKVWELPIPKFDSAEESHLRLAEIGESCTKKVKEFIFSGGLKGIKSVGKQRSMVRQMLKDGLAEIDEIVKEMVK